MSRVISNALRFFAVFLVVCGVFVGAGWSANSLCTNSKENCVLIKSASGDCNSQGITCDWYKEGKCGDINCYSYHSGNGDIEYYNANGQRVSVVDGVVAQSGEISTIITDNAVYLDTSSKEVKLASKAVATTVDVLTRPLVTITKNTDGSYTVKNLANSNSETKFPKDTKPEVIAAAILQSTDNVNLLDLLYNNEVSNIITQVNSNDLDTQLKVYDAMTDDQKAQLSNNYEKVFGSNYDNFKSGGMDAEQAMQMIKAGVQIPTQDSFFKNYATQAKDLAAKITEKEAAIAKETDKKKQSELKKELDSLKANQKGILDMQDYILSDLDVLNSYLTAGGTMESFTANFVNKEGNWYLLYQNSVTKAQQIQMKVLQAYDSKKKELMSQYDSCVSSGGDQQQCMQNYNDALVLAGGTTVNSLSCDDAKKKADPQLCSMQEKLADDLANKLNQNMLVETNSIYSILSAIANPDQNAIKAAKFFGIEANYKDVPAMLRDPIPSQMCVAKIEGYLDKTVENGGGVTKYGCDTGYNVNPRTGKLETGENPNCIKVMGDVRAQMTQITPDDKVAISYSYYIKAPNGGNISYLLAISYVKDGDIIKVPIVDMETVTGSRKDSDVILIPLNDTVEIDVESFKIGLLSAYAIDNDPYIVLTSPVVLVTGGDSYHQATGGGFDNTAGNIGAGSDNINEFTSDDLLDFMN